MRIAVFSLLAVGDVPGSSLLRRAAMGQYGKGVSLPRTTRGA
jgi:hypothetical protein